MIIGDVRGKGLDAVRLASIVLGSYRHVAFERADLRAIVADLDRAVARSVGDEDFVTAALIEERGGTLTIVNCGHPAPLLLRRGRLGHEALQTFGGSGFLQDYPLEQYVRDSKIDTLYEGTTAIQSLDLVFRKIVKDQGKALLVVAGEIQQFLEAEGGNGQLKLERVALGKALTEAQQILGIFTGWLGEAQGGDPEAVYKVGLNSRRFLLALGDIVVGWLLQRQAEVALKALAGEVSAADKSFYEGKVAAAKFFAHEILPRVGADRRIVESTTLDAMQLSEDAF
ncbi:acyl-CoA dehydrogenase C-terminal domain-containing protein [Dactylosporangium sucinum]